MLLKRPKGLTDGRNFWSPLTGWILNAIGNKKRAKRPIHKIFPFLFREDTFYMLYEVNVPCS
jgi:hypothetical protein